MKSSGYRIRIQFHKSVLVAERNNYITKIVNAYIGYDLDYCPKILLSNLKLKYCLFGATNIRKHGDKSKWVYTGYGIVFDGGGLWSFSNEFARNVVIFGVDNSSSSHADNLRKSECPTYDNNGSFVAAEKKISINFSNAKTKY